MEQDGDFFIGFGDSKMKEIFSKMAADQSKINAELARKDAFLSAANIHRPGETFEIRQMHICSLKRSFCFPACCKTDTSQGRKIHIRNLIAGVRDA